MKIGFTGTRKGLTEAQLTALRQILLSGLREPLGSPQILIEARHGDAVGGDEQFHGLCIELKMPEIVIHPPSDPKYRSFCHEHSPGEGDTKITVLPEGPYLDRDHAMVDSVEFLLACPLTVEERLRSGTWATLRYARRINRRRLLITPKGDLKEEV